MMMEQNASRLQRKYKPRNRTRNQKEPENDDGTECQSRETSPETVPGTRWNKDMMMEQNASRLQRKYKPRNRTRNQKEPENDDGTECQKSRETSPGTLNQKEPTNYDGTDAKTQNQKEPRNHDGTECQKTRETSPETVPGILPGTRKS